MHRIQVQTARRIWTFDERKTLRIGSSPDADITLDRSGISPEHAELRPTDSGWELHDCASTGGTWVNNERIEDTTLGPSTAVRFGAAEDGVEAVINIKEPSTAPPDEAASPTETTDADATWVYTDTSSAKLPSGGILIRTRDGDKRFDPGATVRIGRDAGLEVVADDQVASRNHAMLEHRPDGWWYQDTSRSGSYINGERITGKKVTEPTEVHLGHPTAGYKLSLVPMVAISEAQRSIAAKRRRTKYRATPIVSDGYLDIAVMKIIAKDDGGALPTGPLGLPEPVPIGDSNALRTGDRITALGYPALTANPGVVAGPLTITSGDVASFESDPDTHTDRFWIDSTERIGSGNSGGASINNAGELVGINSAVVTTDTAGGNLGEFTSGSSLIRPVALAADVIRIARSGGDPNYVSPYLAKLPHLDTNATATSAGWTKTRSNDCIGSSTEEQPQTLQGVAPGDEIFANFKVTGVPNSTPFTIAFIDDKQNILFKAQAKWKLGPSPQCVDQNLKVVAGIGGAEAILIIGPQNEIKVTNPVKFGGP
jgi:putative serine protease PepD